MALNKRTTQTWDYQNHENYLNLCMKQSTRDKAREQCPELWVVLNVTLCEEHLQKRSGECIWEQMNYRITGLVSFTTWQITRKICLQPLIIDQLVLLWCIMVLLVSSNSFDWKESSSQIIKKLDRWGTIMLNYVGVKKFRWFQFLLQV